MPHAENRGRRVLRCGGENRKGPYRSWQLCCRTALIWWATSILLPAENFEVMVAPMVPYKRYGNGTMVQLKDGRILLAYNNWTILGETIDRSPANVTGRISGDGGRTWGRPFVLHEITSKDSFGRTGPPSLLRLQSGGIAFFYGEMNSYRDFPYYIRRSGDEGETWSEPVRMTGIPAYYILINHRVIQLESGRLLAPFSFIPDARKYYGSPLDSRGSRRGGYRWEGFCLYSDDDGRTWHRSQSTVRLPKYPTGVQEPGVVELKDGSIMMVIRNIHERVYKSYSRDEGLTWNDPEPIEQLVAPRSPAAIMRIPSTGDLVIVWNYSPKKGADTVGARSFEGRRTNLGKCQIPGDGVSGGPLSRVHLSQRIRSDAPELQGRPA